MQNVVLKAFIKEVIKKNLVTAFIIPKAIKKHGVFPGDLSNARSWKTIVYEANSGDETMVGQLDQVRYVMISIDSNVIVPIAIADEHKTGYEVMYTFIQKKIVPDEDYVSMDSWGNTYVYNEEHIERVRSILPKFFAYGGNPNLTVTWYGHPDVTLQELADSGKAAFIKNKVGIKGKILPEGTNIIRGIERLHTLRNSLDLNNERKVRIYIDTAINVAHNFKLLLLLGKDKYKDIEEKLMSYDMEKVDLILFGFNGLENVLHNGLRQALENKGRDLATYKDVFGDIKAAKLEFDRLASL